MILLRIYRGIKSRVIQLLVNHLPYFRFIREPQNPTQHIDFSLWYRQKVLGYNSSAYWPMNATSRVTHAKNILVGKGSFPGFMPGCYIQGIGHIYIGDFSIFSANVGIISANHDIYDSSVHQHSAVRIGSYCWIGMNAVILPGVSLGDYTIVGAGAVVTKSFPDGYCVIGGNPAKVIKVLDREKCKLYKMDGSAYHGYIREDKFDEFAQTNLNLP